MNVRAFQVSRCGVGRKNNEDRSLVKGLENGGILLCVADGMGGHLAGEVAAEIALATMAEFDPSHGPMESQLTDLVRSANGRILKESSKNSSRHEMGTTLTSVLIHRGIAHWVHVGDSRLYIFREGELAQVTEDQTLLGILVRGGEMSPEEARLHPLRNALLSCLGRNGFEAETGSFELQAGDLVMLSTDGLCDALSDEQAACILRQASSFDQSMDALVSAAVSAGGKDDITIILADIMASGDGSRKLFLSSSPVHLL